MRGFFRPGRHPAPHFAQEDEINEGVAAEPGKVAVAA